MNYINKYSWKCLLGRQSKNIHEENEIFFWEVSGRKNFCTDKLLHPDDLSLISGANFHYLSEENCNFLKSTAKVNKSKYHSTRIDLTQFSLVGNKFKSLRHAVNRGKSYNLTVEENYRSLNDVKAMIEEWSNVLAQKYFRDNSGKNYHFYNNNFHQECLNIFLYDGASLVAFGTASPGQEGYSSYILGKALCHRYYGLSEFTDYLLYQKCLENNIKIIDLGQTTGGMIHYKNKFGGAENYTYFNGSVM